MKRTLSFCPVWLAAIGMITISGCSLCCGPDDYNYGTYGGVHPRADMQNGRVGSIFSDPSGTAMNLTPYMEPGDQPENPGQPGDPMNVPNQNDPNLPVPGENDGAYYEYDGETHVTRAKPKRLKNPPQTRKTRQARSFLGGRRMR